MSIRKHTMYNLIGAGIPLGVSLVTIPIYLGVIGESRYGVLAIAWLLLGYFGLFDLGLGRATAQRIAALSDRSARERADAFWTALVINLGLGVSGGLLIWPVAAYFFGHVFQVDELLRPEIVSAVPWLVLAVPMATVSGVLTGALQGRQQFLAINVISVSGTLLFHLLPLGAAIWIAPDLGVLLPAALLARVITLALLTRSCRRHIFGGHAPTVVRTEASRLVRFGGWVTVTAFVGPMMVILDRFIIGAISGARAVTYYTVPFQLAQRSTIIATSLSSAMFPRFAGSTTDQDRKRLTSEGIQVLGVVMTPLVVAGVLLIGPFLAWWIDVDFAEKSAVAGRLLLAGFWINCLANVPFTQLQAQGRPDIVAKCHLVELLPYLGLLYVGLYGFGLAGAALAFSARAALDFLLLSGFAGGLSNSVRFLISPAILVIASVWLAESQAFSVSQETAASVFLLLGTLIWAFKRAPPSIRQFVSLTSTYVVEQTRQSRQEKP